MRFLKTFAVVISVLIMAFVVYAGEMNCMHKMDMKCSSKMKDSDMKEMKTEVHKKMNMSNQAVK